MSAPAPGLVMTTVNLTPAFTNFVDCLGAGTQMTADLISIPCTLICCIIIGILAMNSKSPGGGTSGVGWFLWLVAACCVCSCVSGIMDYMKQKSIVDSHCTSPSPIGQ